MNSYKAKSRVRIYKDGRVYEGVIVSSSIFTDKDTVTLRLDNGYHIGIRVNENTKIDLMEMAAEPDMQHAEHDTEEGEITIITTGGTIASSLDYITGAVKPMASNDEFFKLIPDLKSVGTVSIKPVMNILSENITLADLIKLAKAVYESLKQDKSVIVLHGTDTMAYTASMLSFMIQKPSKPVILVGAQRSIDRPSSDGVLNVTSAARIAKADLFHEVAVAMHASMSDEGIAIHRGSKVRKMHSSRRDAFRTINGLPLGYFSRINSDSGFTHYIDTYYFQPKFDQQYERITGKDFTVWLRKDRMVDSLSGFYPKVDEKVSAVWFHPGVDVKDLEYLHDKHGVVLAGTGLGHVNTTIIKFIRALVKDGIIVVMATECINGRVNMRVYETGRELIKAGVISSELMFLDVAFTKLSWAIGNSRDHDEAIALFRKNVAGELSY